MIRWMFARLEKNPHAVFYQNELVDLFPEESEPARREGLLRRVPFSEGGGYYGFGLPSSYRVVELEDGTFEAFDDEDPEADPITLEAADLAQWRLDLEAVAWRFQQANELSGQAGAIDVRLYFLGEARRDGVSLGFVLALCHGGRSTLNTLRVLPSLLPSDLERFVAVCPSFTPSPMEGRELESLGIFVMPLGTDDLFTLDYSSALRRPSRRVPRVVLTDEEEREFDQARFLSRLPVRMTGRTMSQNRNIIEMGGAKVVLGDAPLKLFLRLVVALHESEDGFLSRERIRYGTGMDSELALAPEGLDQAIGRLRAPFGPALREIKPTQFIEVSRGRVRLSTHRKYVTWDRDALLGHPDEVAQALAQRLPL